MKKILFAVMLMAALGASSCKKKSDDPAPLQNAWTVDFAGNNTTYTSKTVTLNIQGYGVLKSISNDRTAGGYGGVSSTLTVYFKGMPLADKTYKITTLSRIATHDDEVAIEALIFGDPAMGLSQAVWASEGDGSQTLNYKFANSKGSADFSNVTLFNGVNLGKKSAVVSGNIAQ